MGSGSGATVIRFPRILTEQGNLELFREAAQDALQEIGARTQAEVKGIIRKGRDSRGFEGRVDKAIMAKSVTAGRPVLEGPRMHQTTFLSPPADDYGIVHEEGRSPGRRAPPSQTIASWLSRTAKGKLLVEKAIAEFKGKHPGKRVPARARFIKRLGFVVARSIGRKGFPGIWMFKVTAEKFRRGLAGRIYAKHVQRNLGEI